MIVAMDISTENAIAYACMAVVACVLIGCATYLIAKDKSPFGPWDENRPKPDDP